MSFQLADSEKIEFRHGSRFKIKKNNEPEGDLIVTDVRIVWVPHNERDAQPVHTPWTNVEATKKVDPLVDSKQRAGFLVKQISSVGGNKGDLTFFLIANPGETLEKLSSELVRLKSISNKYLKKDGTMTTTTTTSTQPAASASTTASRALSSSTNSNGKRQPPSVINNTDAEMRAKALAARKKQILEADKRLGKQYQDLVLNAKCIDEEEFWATHMPNYASILMLESESGISAGGSGGQFKKGRLNSVKGSGGKLNLTLEQRRDILESDPVARRAYDALVPGTKSEAEFWKLYFAQKKYHRHSSNLEAEETFARFEQRNVTTKAVSASNTGNLTSLGNDSKVKESVKRIESAVHGSQFDMFSNYYDCDRPERFDREDVTFQSKANMNINTESVLAVQPIIRDTGKSMDNNGEGMMEVEDDLKELAVKKCNAYIPLKLTAPTSNTANSSKSSNTQTTADKASTNESTSVKNGSKAPIRVIQSSTGATRGHSRNKRPPLRHLLSAQEMLSAITNINLTMYANEDLDTHSTYVENENEVLSILPTPERALSFFKKDQYTLVEQALLLETLDLQKIGAGSNVNSNNLPSTDSKNKQLKRLGAKFQDEMVEVFTTVTELLRHFYAILSRKGDAAPTQGSSSASKIEKILDRLKAVKDKLASKSQPYRTIIQNSRSAGVSTGMAGGLGGTTIVDLSHKAQPTTSSTETVKTGKEPVKSKEVKDAEAVMQVLSEMAKLISRAEQWWQNYNRG